MGTALSWFRSYLTGRTQFVQLKQYTSKPSFITTGVPQGSVLDPLLFIIYLLPLGNIKGNLLVISIALQMTPNLPNPPSFPTLILSDCVAEIKDWFTSNVIKLNSCKKEILLVGSKPNLAKSKCSSVISDDLSVCVSA